MQHIPTRLDCESYFEQENNKFLTLGRENEVRVKESKTVDKGLVESNVNNPGER